MRIETAREGEAHTHAHRSGDLQAGGMRIVGEHVRDRKGEEKTQV